MKCANTGGKTECQCACPFNAIIVDEEANTTYIDKEKCTGCMVCLRNCSYEAITGAKQEVHVVDQDKCTKCGTCFEVCKFDAVLID